MNPTEQLDAWIAEHGSDALSVALARLELALMALEEVEWVCTPWEGCGCPWCLNEKQEGHSSDCSRQLALESS